MTREELLYAARLVVKYHGALFNDSVLRDEVMRAQRELSYPAALAVLALENDILDNNALADRLTAAQRGVNPFSVRVVQPQSGPPSPRDESQ